jgi:hypothetical protein
MESSSTTSNVSAGELILADDGNTPRRPGGPVRPLLALSCLETAALSNERCSIKLIFSLEWHAFSLKATVPGV